MSHHNPSSAVMEETGRRKRKRRGISDSPESGDDSKKRGRPRVEKQDESAADRRRTQIRMAQRAYRQRKESTLEDLRKRVSELNNTVELMNKVFADCRDRLSATSGISEVALQDLRQTSMQFDALTTATRNSDDEEYAVEKSPAPAEHRASTGSESQSKPAQHSTATQNVPFWLDETVLQQGPRMTTPQEVGLGYTMYVPETEDTTQSLDYFNIDQQVQSLLSTQKSEQLPDFDVLTAETLDDARIPRKLPEPKTYSFQETSFARRLHRACLEAGYYLLSDPTPRPEIFEKVFGLSLLGRDKSKLRASVRAMLARGPHESLDFWEAPLIHVGGAGTHYPRRDQFGNLQPKKASFNLGLVGPQTLALLEGAAKNNLSTDMTVEIAGYEGEWFDPYDVEGYLEERGISIDPSSSFAEAEIVEFPTSPSSATTFSSSQSPSTPLGELPSLDPTAPFDVEQHFGSAFTATDTDNTGWDDFTDLNVTSSIGYSDALTGSWMNFLEPGQGINGVDNHTITTLTKDCDTAGAAGLVQDSAIEALNDSISFRPSGPPQNVPSMVPQQPPRKKSVIIDVSKFIKALTVKGVCLGRSPGYRKKDIERALAMSSFSSF